MFGIGKYSIRKRIIINNMVCNKIFLVFTV